jgi:hypothetical protein
MTSAHVQAYSINAMKCLLCSLRVQQEDYPSLDLPDRASAFSISIWLLVVRNHGSLIASHYWSFCNESVDDPCHDRLPAVIDEQISGLLADKKLDVKVTDDQPELILVEQQQE